MFTSNFPTTLTRHQRIKTENALKALWDKRSVPHIPKPYLTRLTDADLAYLFRFWSHKDRHWAEERDNFRFATQPDFTEEPPQGFTAMFRPLPAADEPAKTVGGRRTGSRGRTTKRP